MLLISQNYEISPAEFEYLAAMWWLLDFLTFILHRFDFCIVHLLLSEKDVYFFCLVIKNLHFRGGCYAESEG